MLCSDACRVCVVNRNSPGALGAITTAVGDLGVNISAQVNVSRETSHGDVAYTVLDLAQVHAHAMLLVECELMLWLCCRSLTTSQSWSRV